MKLSRHSIHAAMLFSIAYLMIGTVHELGHYLVALFYHAKDLTMYHNAVGYDSSELSLNQRINIAAAGPLISLACGIGFQYWCSGRRRRDALFYFILLSSCFGYINFGGYLMMSPFFIGGDTGFIFSALEFPLWLTLGIAAGSVLAMYFQLRSMCHYFVEMGNVDQLKDKESRSRFISELVLRPLFIGIVVTTLLELPVPGVLSLLYPLCSPFSLLWVYGDLLECSYREEFVSASLNGNSAFNGLDHLHYPWYIVGVLSLVLNRLLVFGIQV